MDISIDLILSLIMFVWWSWIMWRSGYDQRNNEFKTDFDFEKQDKINDL